MKRQLRHKLYHKATITGQNMYMTRGIICVMLLVLIFGNTLRCLSLSVSEAQNESKHHEYPYIIKSSVLIPPFRCGFTRSRNGNNLEANDCNTSRSNKILRSVVINKIPISRDIHRRVFGNTQHPV